MKSTGRFSFPTSFFVPHIPFPLSLRSESVPYILLWGCSTPTTKPFFSIHGATHLEYLYLVEPQEQTYQKLVTSSNEGKNSSNCCLLSYRPPHFHQGQVISSALLTGINRLYTPSYPCQHRIYAHKRTAPFSRRYKLTTKINRHLFRYRFINFILSLSFQYIFEQNTTNKQGGWYGIRKHAPQSEGEGQCYYLYCPHKQ